MRPSCGFSLVIVVSIFIGIWLIGIQILADIVEHHILRPD